jgi:hypothetical protein
VTLAIWEKLEQPDPWQRSMRYAVTATLSVDAAHVRVTSLGPATALRFVGAVGAWVSGAASVVADVVVLKLLQLGTASRARTRYE